MQEDLNCVFCKISKGVLKDEILYLDDDLFVVRDINPRTPSHFLIITHKHYASFSELSAKEPLLISKIAQVVEIIVERFNLRNKSKFGYTWGFHCGGKESVSHVHAQLIAEMLENELVL